MPLNRGRNTGTQGVQFHLIAVKGRGAEVWMQIGSVFNFSWEINRQVQTFLADVYFIEKTV